MSSVYRIYDGAKGYKEPDYRYSIIEVIKQLDKMIDSERIEKILVIEHNKELDTDFPIYLYLGSYESYVLFREKYVNEDIVKDENIRRRK